MGRRRRRRVIPTDDWEQLEFLCVWAEQKEYERIRSLVLFGEPDGSRSPGGVFPSLWLSDAPLRARVLPNSWERRRFPAAGPRALRQPP